MQGQQMNQQMNQQPMAIDKITIFEGHPTCCGSFSEWCSRTRWLITNHYIEKESGLCCTQIDNLQLIRVKDMEFKGACCCCGSCSTITIMSTDTTSPTLLIKGIPNGKQVYEGIRNAVNNIQGGARLEIQTS